MVRSHLGFEYLSFRTHSAVPSEDFDAESIAHILDSCLRRNDNLPQSMSRI